MNNKEIAFRIACHCYSPKEDYDTGYALQLFVEKAVLPDGVSDYYDITTMERYVFDFLEKENS